MGRLLRDEALFVHQGNVTLLRQGRKRTTSFCDRAETDETVSVTDTLQRRLGKATVQGSRLPRCASPEVALTDVLEQKDVYR